MFSYTVTIGRNYSTGNSVLPSMRGQAMTLTNWHQFVGDIKADMLSFAVDAAIHMDSIEVHYGRGTWDGVPEDSAKITLLTIGKADERALDVLRRYLSQNARHYGQDAIALTVGESELC